MRPLEIDYKNWRGVTSRRRIIPLGVRYGSTEWHPEEQWLLSAIDVEKGAVREFAMSEVIPVLSPSCN